MKFSLSLILCAAAPLLFAGLTEENRKFEKAIELGQQVLERRHVPRFLSGIDRHFPDAVQKFSKLSPEQVRQELEAYERIMLQLSVRSNGQPYTPNIGWYTKKRAKDYESEIKESIKDWRRSAAVLAKAGLDAECEFEIGRINTIRANAPKVRTLPSDAVFDQAFSFYKSVIEERFRLGARIITLENELEALKRTAAFRESLGGTHIPVRDYAVRQKLEQWRNMFNAKKYSSCAQLEKQTVNELAKIRARFA